MGIREKIDGWLQERKERQWRQRMFHAATYFGRLLENGKTVLPAVRQCVEDYKDFPEMTRRQAELLLEHGSLHGIRQVGSREWRAVMETLAATRYGRQTLNGTYRNVGEKAENPLLRLFAQYEVLKDGYDRLHGVSLSRPDGIEAKRQEACRLLNFCQRERDLAALKGLALKGKRPEDSVILRYGLEAGYRELDNLQRRWAEERREDDYPGMERTGQKMDREKGKLMRQAAIAYEKRLAGKLPRDYLEAAREERWLLGELARNGWSEKVEVPKTVQDKYGLSESFSEIASLRWDYHLGMDNGDSSCEYPKNAIDRHSRLIREQAARELEKLEERLFPVKTKRQGHGTGRQNGRRQDEPIRQERIKRGQDDERQRPMLRRIRKL